jgi:TRAP-type transport system periplasmic protein
MLRRQMLAGGASAYAAIGMLRFPAKAAEFSYKLGSNEQPTHSIVVRALQASARIGHESGGRMEIKVFPSGSLGTDAQRLAQLRIGALEFQTIGDNILANVVPLAAISTVPFAFATYKDAWNAMDGPLGAYVRNTIAKANIYALARHWDAGMREISNNVKPIVTPDDLKGLKIRVPEAPFTIAYFKALGCSPTPIDGSQLYTSLQTHLVDGFEAGMDAMESNKWYEVSKYISLTNHQWTGFTLIANADAWQRLPKNLRDIVERNFDAAAILNRADILRGESTLETTLKGQGIAFNQSDSPSFKAVIRNAGLFAQWRDSFGSEPWALLEKAVGKLV